MVARRYPYIHMSRRSLNHKRRFYLCTYDVADDKRRNKLFETLKDNGEHVQYSVFLCELNDREHALLSSQCREILHEGEDQLLILDVGSAIIDLAQNLTSIGKEWTPLIRSHII